MKLTRAQLRKFLIEEVEVLSYKIPKGKTDIIIDNDSPSEVKAKEDSWAGGQNIHSQEEHQLKMGTKEKTVRGIEKLKIAEDRKRLRKAINQIVSEVSYAIDDEDSSGLDEREVVTDISNAFLVGMMAINSLGMEDISEDILDKYSSLIYDLISSDQDMTKRLARIFKEFKEDDIYGDTLEGPALSREEILDLVVANFRVQGRGELSEQDFRDVIEDLANDSDFISYEEMMALNITYDEVLLAVGDIENVGMPTDRP